MLKRRAFDVFILIFTCRILVLASGHNRELAKKYFVSNNQYGYKSMAALMFSSSAAAKTVSSNNRTVACRWLRGYRHYNNFCKKRKGLTEALVMARYLAVSHCKEQFRYDRWNCTNNKKTVFKRQLRETALLHALSSSAIMYSIARSCAEGKFQNCKCAEPENSENKGHNWKWGGCGDNIKQAKAITKRFLQVRPNRYGPHDLVVHNSLIGLRVASESKMKVCTCHGLSASCVMKTCWQQLKPFSKIAEKLKEKYHSAIQLPASNFASVRNRKLPVKSGKLLYSAQSPNYCSNTVGRRCSDAGNCATLCCNRGFEVRETATTNPCNCRWKRGRCCSEFECDICTSMVDVYVCK